MIVRPVVCVPFIGRSRELALLRDRRVAAAKAHGGLILVTGEAGVGKSRLAGEFARLLPRTHWRIGHGACLPQLQRPYGPVLDALAAYDRSLPPLAHEATKADLFDAILRRFEQAANTTCVAAIVEDIHWADLVTLELLDFLATKAERLRILIVATMRPSEHRSDPARDAALARLLRATRSSRIDLTPFDEPDTRLLIDTALSGMPFSLPLPTRRNVARICEGNAFFAEELLQVAIERLAADASQRAAPEALPSSIRATLLERWHLLDPAERTIIAHAAVIGRTFDLALLVRTLETTPEATLPALQRARNAQLVEELSDSTFRFRHALTREAIYAEFLGAQVRPLHRVIAQTLEALPDDERSIEDLAYHWWSAGDRERSARYNEPAGDAAAGAHAHEEAIAFYERAMESASLEVAARARIQEKIADRLVVLGATDRAREAYALAADRFAELHDDDHEAYCRVRFAQTTYVLELPHPVSSLEALLERLGPHATSARARVHLGIAWIAASLWSPSRAAHHLAQIDARMLATDAEAALRFHNVSAWVAMTIADLATFRSEHRAWLDAAATSPRIGLLAAAHYNGAACYTLFGLHEEAAAHIERALAVAREERSTHGVVSALAISAACRVASGDLAGARAALAELTADNENQIMLADAVAAGTIAGSHLDDAVLTDRWFAVGREAMGEQLDSSCGAGLAEVLVRRGEPVEARAVLERAIRPCERPRGNMATLVAAARLGDPTTAARARAQLAATAAADAATPERAALALFDAYVARREGRHDDAVASARDAASGFRAFRFPLFEAAALEAAGQTVEACAIYERTGAIADERRLRESRPDRTHGASVLSEREREIAVLVARGNANAAIARVLNISPKTVEKHLSTVYRKLGFTSRTQLAVYASEPESQHAKP
jgi:DNA-binding NarL/FixJ family response regulator